MCLHRLDLAAKVVTLQLLLHLHPIEADIGVRQIAVTLQEVLHRGDIRIRTMYQTLLKSMHHRINQIIRMCIRNVGRVVLVMEIDQLEEKEGLLDQQMNHLIIVLMATVSLMVQ